MKSKVTKCKVKMSCNKIKTNLYPRLFTQFQAQVRIWVWVQGCGGSSIIPFGIVKIFPVL